MLFFRRQARVPLERLEAVLNPREMERVLLARAARKSQWAECYLTWPPGVSVDGVLLDVSDTGARVRFSTHEAFPDRVTLVCPKLRLRRDAEIARRDGTDVGFAFILQ